MTTAEFLLRPAMLVWHYSSFFYWLLPGIVIEDSTSKLTWPVGLFVTQNHLACHLWKGTALSKNMGQVIRWIVWLWWASFNQSDQQQESQYRLVEPVGKSNSCQSQSGNFSPSRKPSGPFFSPLSIKDTPHFWCDRCYWGIWAHLCRSSPCFCFVFFFEWKNVAFQVCCHS